MKTIHRGFTLIEVMVVVAILGVLATITAPVFKGFFESSKAQAVHTVVNQMDGEIKSLASLHGVSSSAGRGALVKSGNSYLDVLAFGEDFVTTKYANAYSLRPHINIKGFTTIKMPKDGEAGEYQFNKLTVSIGSSTSKNEYVFKGMNEVTLASYLEEYAKEETFQKGQSGGGVGDVSWAFNDGLYDVTISRPLY